MSIKTNLDPALTAITIGYIREAMNEAYARIVIKPVDKPPPKPKPTAREKADKVWKGKK